MSNKIKNDVTDFSNITPLPSQNKFISSVLTFTDVNYFFFIGGYGSGKSFCLVILLIILCKLYQGYNIRILLCATTLGDIYKFILENLFKILIVNNIPYTLDKRMNILYIGDTTIFLVPNEEPDRIYGFTSEIALIDEIDELKKDIAERVFMAISERNRGNRLPDRYPFQAYFTTAQGTKRALYNKLNELKEKGIKYCVVRGRTSDNIYNSKSYVENLLKLYNEEEKKAFLEGYFVNFNSGLVYPDFDPQTMVIQPFEINPDEIIYVGQDKNIGFNKSVCVIKRDKKLYVIKTLTTEYIQDVPRIIRGLFPQNPIYWYPDVSAKEILGGYAQEIRKYNITLKVSNINPSILSRIFVVNKLYKTKRCFIFNTEKELINAHSTRCYDNSGKPEKIGGEKCPSHICDADEYVKWRIVFSDPDFADIRSLILNNKNLNYKEE